MSNYYTSFKPVRPYSLSFLLYNAIFGYIVFKNYIIIVILMHYTTFFYKALLKALSIVPFIIALKFELIKLSLFNELVSDISFVES